MNFLRMTARPCVARKTAAISILAVILFSGLAMLRAQQPPREGGNGSTPHFDFSVYFTGNVQGNLEPCG